MKKLIGLLSLIALVFFTACQQDDMDDTSYLIVYDCDDLELDIGDTCTIGNTFGIVDLNCVCVPFSEFDCPDLGTNIGDECPLDPAGTEWGVTNEACECVEIDFDCPGLQLNIEDNCITSIGTAGTVNADCECEPVNTNSFDCPDLGTNIGDECPLNPAGTEWGYTSEACECVEFDCPDLQLNIGNGCTTIGGDAGTVNNNCECEPSNTSIDCPNLGTNIGDECPLNPAGTEWGITSEACECVEIDCLNLGLNIGEPCPLNPAGTEWGTVNADCECEE